MRSILIICLFLSTGLLASERSEVISTSNKIVFLHFNDFYSIEDNGGKGGLVPLYYTIEQQKQRYPNTILSFGGDLLSPSFHSSSTKGKHMIEAMKLLSLDIATIGNHEFDFGIDNAIEQIKNSDFPWVISNLLHKGKALKNTNKIYVKTINGLRIGFFGIITPELDFLSQTKTDITITDTIATARQMVAVLKQKNVDIIVALTHLNLQEDKLLALKVNGIDLILGGHDHYPLSLKLNNTLIIKAGLNGEYLSVVELDYDKLKPKGSRIDFSWQFISSKINKVSPILSTDSTKKLSLYLKEYQQQIKKEKNKNIATTLIELDATEPQLRSAESNFANLVADAIRLYYKTDFSLINGGAIRSDRKYPAKSVLQSKDILTALPFNNRVVVVKLTGRQLIKILEHGVSAVEKYNGRFPQVSGFNYTFSIHKPIGHRIIYVGFSAKEIFPDKLYTLATLDYLFKGGDGYVDFKSYKAIIDSEQGELLSTIVIDYLENLQQIKYINMGRISSDPMGSLLIKFPFN
jgi:2',3'-cyclic-nucleotide 2'-phosphodiesterase (5'-nucleotidase family)